MTGGMCASIMRKLSGDHRPIQLNLHFCNHMLHICPLMSFRACFALKLEILDPVKEHLKVGIFHL